jgi:hypothetical protein
LAIVTKTTSDRPMAATYWIVVMPASEPAPLRH